MKNVFCSEADFPNSKIHPSVHAFFSLIPIVKSVNIHPHGFKTYFITNQHGTLGIYLALTIYYAIIVVPELHIVGFHLFSLPSILIVV